MTCEATAATSQSTDFGRTMGLAGAALPIANPSAEPAPLGTAQTAPHTFGLVGGKRVLEAFVPDGTGSTDCLGRRDNIFVLSDREEHFVVRAGTGGLIPPIIFRLKKEIVER